MYVIDASVFVADARPAEPYHIDAHTLLTHVITKRQIVYVPTIVLADNRSEKNL